MGTHELKGDRGYQEDRVQACVLAGGERFVACYDGHCGEVCAEYCKVELHGVLEKLPGFGADATTGEALAQAFVQTNDQFVAKDPETADPEHGGAYVIDYEGRVDHFMRDEIRDAGDADGYAALHDTWLGKFYADKTQVVDFALLPVSCGE